MEIYLIRHTVVHNPEKLCYGQSEIALAQSQDHDFEQLAQKLVSDIDQEVVYFSSPYKRCTALAAYLSGNKYIIDQRLSEMNFGAWESCAWSGIETETLNTWMNDFVNAVVPGGESFEQMHQRCGDFWEGIIRKSYKKVIVVTHAGVIRSILARILHIPLQMIFSVQIDYSSVNKIMVNQSSGSMTVNYINR